MITMFRRNPLFAIWSTFTIVFPFILAGVALLFLQPFDLTLFVSIVLVFVYFAIFAGEIIRQWNRAQRALRRPNRLKLVEQMDISLITPELVRGESNQEVRQIYMRRLGLPKYLALVGAKRESVDDFGEVYTWDSSNSRAVKVINSTPDPDGTFKEYWIRIPSRYVRQVERYCQVCGKELHTAQLNTPKEAIAWTFKICEPHYNPQLMS